MMLGRSQISILQKKVLFTFLLLGISLNLCYSQVNKTFRYTSEENRLLIEISGNYFFSSNQGEIDIDSAMLLAAGIYGLNTNLISDIPVESKLKFEFNESTIRGAIEKNSGMLKKWMYVELAEYFIKRPGKNPSDLDSAGFYLNQSGLDKDIRFTLFQNTVAAQLHMQQGHYNLGKKKLERSIWQALSSKDYSLQGYALEMAGTYLSNSDINKRRYLEQAYSIYKKNGKTVKVCSIVNKLIIYHFYKGNFEKAILGLKEMVNIQKSIGFEHRHYPMMVLAYLSQTSGSLFKALEYVQEAISAIKKSNDPCFSVYAYLRAGHIYNELGQSEKAISMFKIALGQKIVSGDNYTRYKAYLSIISSLLEMDDINYAKKELDVLSLRIPPSSLWQKMVLEQLYGNAYLKMNQRANAGKAFKKMVSYANKLKHSPADPDVGLAYILFSDFLLEERKQKEATYYLRLARSLPPSVYRIENRAIMAKIEYKLDSLNGKAISSLRKFQLYRAILDSANNLQDRRKVNELEMRYEFERKNHLLALKDKDVQLLNREKTIQDNKYKQSQYFIIFVVCLLFSLIAILFLVLNRYKQKQEIEKETLKNNLILQNLLKEKEWLLKEIHHRVKNNLQMVTGLLNSQSSFLPDGPAKSAIQDSRGRVQTMAIIHQKLYTTGEKNNVYLEHYIVELLEYLKGHIAQNQQIKVSHHIEKLEVNISIAVTLGLIINEAFTNCVKHAFKDRADAAIEVVLQKEKDSLYALKIKDNGNGVPLGFNTNNPVQATFGISLMRGLSEDLEAVFEVKSNKNEGTSIVFLFNPFEGE